MFSVVDALEKRGHSIIPFSIRYARNRTTPYSGYFARPLGSEEEVTFRSQRMTPKTVVRTLQRLFYAPDVDQAVTHIVRDTQPQVAYVLHYLRKLSPSLLVGLKRMGLPIIVRLSDYAMLCPQAHCVRNDQVCDLCVHDRLLPSVKYRCVQNSLGPSLLNAAATLYHRLRGFFDLVDVFVTTNQFMYQMMRSAGFLESRLRCIPTFVDTEAFRPVQQSAKCRYIAYVGRLERFKGVHILVDAMRLLVNSRPDLDVQLLIAGTGDDDYASALRRQVSESGLQDVVSFLGLLETGGLRDLLSKAQVSVVPSLWYENLPNSLLESYACGTPVVASNIGSLKECVRDGETGFLFRPAEAASLQQCLQYCLDHPAHLAQMSEAARRTAQDQYSASVHLRKLESLFAELVGGC